MRVHTVDEPDGIGELFYNAVKSHQPFYPRILDVGCGYGIATRYMRHLCDKMSLIDISLSAIDSQRHIWENDENVDMSCGTIMSMDGQYDLIYYFMSMHHISDIAAELTKVKSLLTEEGELAICEIGSIFDTPFHQNESVPFDGFQLEYLSDILIKNGFIISNKERITKLEKNNLDYDIISIICRVGNK